MPSSDPHRPDRARFWREPGFADAELLTASYRNHRFPPHVHDEFALGVIERGAQAYRGEGRRTIMPQGTICAINPGEMHEGGPATAAGWDYRMLYIPSAGLIHLLEQAGDAPRGLPHFAAPVIDDPATMALLRLAHACAESADTTQLEKTSRLTAAVFQLVRRHAGVRPAHLRRGPVPGAVKRAREYIDAHVTDNPNLDCVAAHAGMSAWHLLREFKKTVGIAPHAYLVQRRVELARHLLLRGQPLRRIAIDIGYCDQGHLSREFKRFFGVPPGAARA